MRSRRAITRAAGIAIGGGCALLFAAYGLAEALLRDKATGSFLQYAAAFGCFGFMLGSIFAFDADPGDPHESRPILRTLLCGLAGLAFGWVTKFPPEGIALSAMAGAALGYLGLIWARYV